jgi:hypothetical protein
MHKLGLKIAGFGFYERPSSGICKILARKDADTKQYFFST